MGIVISAGINLRGGTELRNQKERIFMNSIKRNTVMTMGAAALFAMGIAQADDSAALRTESNRLELNAALSGQTQAGTRIIHD